MRLIRTLLSLAGITGLVLAAAATTGAQGAFAHTAAVHPVVHYGPDGTAEYAWGNTDLGADIDSNGAGAQVSVSTSQNGNLFTRWNYTDNCVAQDVGCYQYKLVGGDDLCLNADTGISGDPVALATCGTSGVALEKQEWTDPNPASGGWTSNQYAYMTLIPDCDMNAHTGSLLVWVGNPNGGGDTAFDWTLVPGPS